MCMNINYYPLILKDDGKQKILFKEGIKVNTKDDYLKLDLKINQYLNGYMPVRGKFLKFVNIPCGSCSECLTKKARDMTLRLYQEIKLHSNCWFITLTYAPENIPLNDKGLMTLKKSDISDFNKKLKVKMSRKNIESTFKFFACGEYGEKNFHPHYHGIYYDLNIPDLKYFKTLNGKIYYTSEFLSSVWKKGFITISQGNLFDIAYVAQYVEKKQILNKSQKDYIKYKYHIEPEFQFGSKHLGINILDDIIDKIDKNIYNYYCNGKSYSIPKYIRNYLPDEYREKIIEDYSKKIGLVNLNRNIRVLDNVESLEYLHQFDVDKKKIRDLQFL